jgi:hypothetical protein
MLGIDATDDEIYEEALYYSYFDDRLDKEKVLVPLLQELSIQPIEDASSENKVPVATVNLNTKRVSRG